MEREKKNIVSYIFMEVFKWSFFIGCVYVGRKLC